ncbi:MAG: aminopeptidase P family protein [Bacteroidales bacterium]
MRYKTPPADLFNKSRKKIKAKLAPHSLVLVFSADLLPRNGDQYHTYRQDSDFYYLTGIDQEMSILAFAPDHPNEEMREMLFLRETNEHIAVWEGERYTKAEAREQAGIANVQWLEAWEDMLPQLLVHTHQVYLNFNENPRFHLKTRLPSERMAERLRKHYPGHPIKRLAPLLEEARLRKENEEIDQIREACRITGDAFKRIAKELKPGFMEYEVEALMSYEFIRQGGSGHAFTPIVASGQNACVLHYITNNHVCTDGELVLLDFGTEYGNYASDCSRTLPVNGKFTKRQRAIYEAVLRVFKQARQLMVPGNTIGEIHRQTLEWLQDEHIELGLYSLEDLHQQDVAHPLVKKYYPHGTAHFMGLDVHDVGGKNIVLQEGMVLTCEPGIYIPEEGIGIRLENDILVAPEPIDLMEHIPIEPDDIEKIMR